MSKASLIELITEFESSAAALQRATCRHSSAERALFERIGVGQKGQPGVTTGRQEQIVGALRSGPKSTAELRAVLGDNLQRHHFNDAITPLIKQGLVKRSSYGMYRLAITK